jgi:hypothetical protein
MEHTSKLLLGLRGLLLLRWLLLGHARKHGDRRSRRLGGEGRRIALVREWVWLHVETTIHESRSEMPHLLRHGRLALELLDLLADGSLTRISSRDERGRLERRMELGLVGLTLRSLHILSGFLLLKSFNSSHEVL